MVEGRAGEPARVLIIAQDLDRERILAIVSHHSPNTLLLLRNSRDTAGIKASMQETIKLLKRDLRSRTEDGIRLLPFLKSVVTREVDFTDIPEAVAKIDEAIREQKRKGNEVRVDISGGIKPIAVAMYLAANLNKTEITYAKEGVWGDPTSIRRLYGEVKKSSDTSRQKRFTFSIESVKPLPWLPIGISKDFAQISFEILEKLAAKDDGFSPSMAEIVGTAKARIMLGHRHMPELVDLGYVAVRNTGYQITQAGRAILRLKECSFIPQGDGATR